MCEEKKDNQSWLDKDPSEWTEDDEQEAFLNIIQMFQ